MQSTGSRTYFSHTKTFVVLRTGSINWIRLLFAWATVFGAIRYLNCGGMSLPIVVRCLHFAAHSETAVAISATLYCCVRAVECIICELTFGKLFVTFIFPFGV